MKQLSGKHILLGVTGSIAAYKSAELVRLLRDAGAEVRVVMTQAAGEFITPLTLQALSGHPVHRELLDAGAEAAMGHIELARWADAVLVAPASADCIARLAQGRANDLLAAVCLVCEAPLAVAPAMNRAMWENAATVENIDTLRRRGIRVKGPAQGEQACGEVGEGRMMEVSDMLTALRHIFDAHLHEPGLDGERIAHLCGVSKRTLYRRLSEQGTSLKQELDQLRLDKASTALIAGERSVADIGASLGYHDPSVFTRTFRRWTGKSPSEYRTSESVHEH